MSGSTRRPVFWSLTFACFAALPSAPSPALAQLPCDPPTMAPTMPHEEHPGALRESEISAIPKGAEVPQIGFIDSPTATCYQPDPQQNVCFINWYYMSVDASPNYMICMEATINAIGKVASFRGFFQTSIYVPYNMNFRGFQVECGLLGAGGDPNRGNAWAWTIRAQDSSNLRSANYGTIYCPAYIP